MRDSLAGLERAKQVIGYEPAVTVREGLQRTWAWFAAARRPSEVVARAAAIAQV